MKYVRAICNYLNFHTDKNFPFALRYRLNMSNNIQYLRILFNYLLKLNLHE